VDFVVSRAVMPLPDLIKLSRKNISAEERNGIPNGVITLKGGELEQELGRYKKMTEIIPLSGFFPDEEFFATKCITYTPVK
jgi:16S rRNA (guanine527-N7)-methyltransferase